MLELPDEVFHFTLPSINAIVAFAEDVCFECEEELQGLLIILTVGVKTGVEWTVNILAEEDPQTLRFRQVDQRSRRVAGDVSGLNSSFSQLNEFSRSRYLSVNYERVDARPIPVGSRYHVVPSFQKSRIQLMGHRLAVEELSQRCGSPGVVKMAVGEEEHFYLFRSDPAGSDVGQQAFIGIAAAGIDEGCMTVEIDEIDGRVLRRGKRSSPNLKDFISDLYFAHLSIPLTFS